MDHNLPLDNEIEICHEHPGCLVIVASQELAIRIHVTREMLVYPPAHTIAYGSKHVAKIHMEMLQQRRQWHRPRSD